MEKGYRMKRKRIYGKGNGEVKRNKNERKNMKTEIRKEKVKSKE